MDRGRESAEVEVGGGFGVEEVDVDGAPVGGCHCGLEGVGYEGLSFGGEFKMGGQLVDRGKTQEWALIIVRNWRGSLEGGMVIDASEGPDKGVADRSVLVRAGLALGSLLSCKVFKLVG